MQWVVKAADKKLKQMVDLHKLVPGNPRHCV